MMNISLGVSAALALCGHLILNLVTSTKMLHILLISHYTCLPIIIIIDLTKKAVTSTTSGVEGAVRTVTRNVEYKFGDITKGVINSTTSGVEDVVKEVTGIDGE